MNPTAIYSKSGKGVQEASGKTSILKRPDRAVLSAIDGRATLAEIAEKVGKSFDPAFEALITQLDKDGFVREVSPGVAPAAPKAAAPAKGKAAPPPSSDAPDLDFSSIAPAPQPAAPPPPPKPSGPSPAELAAKAEAAKRAKEQESAMMKARQEAEARAQAERERMRKEAEEKIRAETEAKMRAEAEQKMKADTDAKAKVIRAAAEAKVKAEAEAKKAREEAERVRKEADEKADKARREVEEKAKREQEEMRKQLEAERKAREEAEKKAKEEAERARKEAEEKAKKEQEEMRRQLEEERKRIEAERKAREEEDRKRREKEEEERAARRKKEEEEAQERKRKREEEEARYRKEEEERQARRKKDEEEERKRQEERARKAKEEEEERARRRREEEEEETRREEERARKQSEATVLATPAVAPPPPPPAQPVGASTGSSSTGGMDSLLADLDSFGKREEEEQKAKEEAERKAREAEEKRRREAEEKRRREEEERSRKEAEDRRRREEEERRAREDEERRQREEEERAKREAEERKRKAREAMAAKQAETTSAVAARAAEDDIGVSEDDLDMDDIKADEAKVSAESKRAARERQREREEAGRPAEPVVGSKPRRPVKWGKPVALTLFVLLIAGVGLIHVMPVSVGEYERAASEALGQPVKIGSGRLSVITGVRVTFSNVQVGSAKIGSVRAHPDVGSLFGARKSFSRVELDGLVVPQQAMGEALFAKVKGENFQVARVSASGVKFDGPLVLPALDLDATIGADGTVSAVNVRGADSLLGKITPKDSNAEFDISTGGFAVPFAPEIKFSAFSMKGTANREGMNIAAWDAQALTGTLTGTANIRWGSTWNVDGVVTARGINAGVFAPALLSEGRGEGTGKFSMSGEPAQLAGSSRLDANFTITKGALSVLDLSRAIQTSGRQASGRTPFSEMAGQATYEKGAVALRNVTMGAGALNAGISADIAETGALSGRIVADVKTATQTLRASFSLAGTVKEPQVR